MPGVYSVSQVSAYIKHLFTNDYALSALWVRGEISNCKYHSSGHVYFTLKDDGAQISCVLFASQRAKLLFRLQDGQQVEAQGQVSLYEKAGTYQLYVRNMRLSGQGVLYERFLKLKAELQEMGMFDACYKKPIPRYAMRIGIVTAPTGAAIQDICNISKRRNPYVELILYPALVQGAHAKESIVRGIETLDQMHLDVIIVGRGGGSIEDLWAFNEECVARAIFNAETPVISAVGHETDWTIADFVADKRAPTPSAAAELANFEYAQFAEELSARADALYGVMNRKIRETRMLSDYRRQQLEAKNPAHVLLLQRERLRALLVRLDAVMQALAEKRRHMLKERRQRLDADIGSRLAEVKHRLALLAGRLDGASPLKKIGGGYGYISGKDGRAVTSVQEVRPGDELGIVLKDGTIRARAEELRRGEEQPWKNERKQVRK